MNRVRVVNKYSKKDADKMFFIQKTFVYINYFTNTHTHTHTHTHITTF
jgi:hypothetical protein